MSQNQSKTIQKAMVRSAHQKNKKNQTLLSDSESFQFFQDAVTNKEQNVPEEVILATSRYTLVNDNSELYQSARFQGPLKIFRNFFCQLNLLKEEKNNILDEVEGMLNDFKLAFYLFQRQVERLLREIFNSKLQEKNHTIFLLTERIKKFQEEELNQEINKKLELQNKKLRDEIQFLKKNYLILRDENQILKSRINSSDELKRTVNSDFHDSYEDEHEQMCRSENPKLLRAREPTFKLKKNQSMIRERKEIITDSAGTRKQINDDMRSLDKIKERLSKLRTNIEQQYPSS